MFICLCKVVFKVLNHSKQGSGRWGPDMQGPDRTDSLCCQTGSRVQTDKEVELELGWFRYTAYIQDGYRVQQTTDDRVQ